MAKGRQAQGRCPCTRHPGLVQTPSKDNGETAIVRATVQTSKGSFTGIGDASPENVNPGVVRHLLRVAETRAKARALRDAVNIGTVSLEELGAEIDDDALYEGKVVPVQEGGNGRRETAPREAAIPAGGKSTSRPSPAATTATRDATTMSHGTASATPSVTTTAPPTSMSAPHMEAATAEVTAETRVQEPERSAPPPFFTGTEAFNVGAKHGAGKPRDRKERVSPKPRLAVCRMRVRKPVQGVEGMSAWSH